MSQVTLHYFDGRARAELARLILVAGGIKFNDHRISFDEWPKLKPSTPTGQLPYLQVDDTQIPQSIALSRYVAKLANLAGRDDIEQAKTDAIVDTCNEMMMSYYPGVFRAENYETAYKIFLEKEAAVCLAQLEKLIALYGKDDYSVGNTLTWADLLIYEICSQLIKDNKTYLSKYPLILKVCAKVNSNQRVNDYVKSRKPTQF